MPLFIIINVYIFLHVIIKDHTCAGLSDVYMYYTFFYVYLIMSKCHSCKGNLIKKINKLGASSQCGLLFYKTPFVLNKVGSDSVPTDMLPYCDLVIFGLE